MSDMREAAARVRSRRLTRYFVHRTGWGNPDIKAIKFVGGDGFFLFGSKSEEATHGTLTLQTAILYSRDESSYGWRELDEPAEVVALLGTCYRPPPPAMRLTIDTTGIEEAVRAALENVTQLQAGDTVRVQLQDGLSPEWTCPRCHGDALWCGCIEKARAALAPAVPEQAVRPIKLRD